MQFLPAALMSPPPKAAQTDIDGWIPQKSKRSDASGPRTPEKARESQACNKSKTAKGTKQCQITMESVAGI